MFGKQSYSLKMDKLSILILVHFEVGANNFESSFIHFSLVSWSVLCGSAAYPGKKNKARGGNTPWT